MGYEKDEVTLWDFTKFLFAIFAIVFVIQMGAC